MGHVFNALDLAAQHGHTHVLQDLGLFYRRSPSQDRLVAQGYRQRANDSYDPDHISSPVVHKESLWLFLAVCAHLNLRVHQADVKAAFIQAPLSERIFM